MISLPNFKVLLGPYAHELSTEQIEQLYVFEYKIAGAVVDRWFRKQSFLALFDDLFSEHYWVATIMVYD